ncbi:hypothetical protein [Paenibacillus sp. FSL K6-1318]|uniref:hypothetical protein n=1 Tax=Paenibacillus sp. FSL K6-1318 TaxID=2975291 RepID=UPI0030EEBD01
MTQTALTKKELKQIEITEMEIKKLYTWQDMEGEWNTDINIHFMLSQPCTFELLGQVHNVDRVKMFDQYGEITFGYANENKDYCCFPVSKIFIDKIRKRVIQEQRPDGMLKGWDFNHEFLDVLQGDSLVVSCW